MLIICEDCAKRYNIDDSRIKGNRARFTCRECGHIIIVEKSDLTRRLISASNPSPAPQDDAGTIDLLKEMEVAAGPSDLQATPEAGQQDSSAGEDRRQGKQGLPVFIYFLPAFVVAFLGTGGMLGYLIYTGSVAQPPERAGGSWVMSILLLGLVWLLSLGILFIAARGAAATLTKLQEAVVRLGQGEQEIKIPTGGPREVRELAATLARVFRFRQ